MFNAGRIAMMPMITAEGLVPEFVPEALRLAEPPPRGYRPEAYALGFRVEGLAPCVDAAHKAVQWWLNDILHGCKERRRWLTLFGRSGCGKSHLALAARGCLRAHGRRVQCWNWAVLRERLLGGCCPGLMEQVQGLPVLLLDDVGAEYLGSDRAAGVSASLLYRVLEARLGRWTLLTSNLAPADWVDVRITSRLYRGLNELVDMSGAADFCFACRKGVAR